jgi:hypothetical protein
MSGVELFILGGSAFYLVSETKKYSFYEVEKV